MNKIMTTIVLALFGTAATADYTMVVPQRVGGGTSQWTTIVAGELEKHLGEKIIIDHHPGARDIPGFNKWHNEMQGDDKTIMVSHGGNGVSFLIEKVEYNYNDYRPIGAMNLDIIIAKRKETFVQTDKIIFSAGSGQTPEGLAIFMMQCGPLMDPDCFKDEVSWVKGMRGGERRLAFKRGELNATRENPASYKKHVEPDPNSELWFTHGISGPNGTRLDDPEYPGYRFEDVYEARWGVPPSGPTYDAYVLVRAFRDGLQKALWVSKDNPNADKIIAAMNSMLADPASVKAIQKKAGKYPWVVGEEAEAHVANILGLVQEKPLKDLVEISDSMLGLASVYKPELIK
jgi:hypothetical protein